MRQPSVRLFIPLVAVVLHACGGAGGGEFVIGAAGAWNDANTRMTRSAIEMAISEGNAAAARRGTPRLRVEFVDDSGSGTGAVRVASRLVADREVVAVIGHLNSGPMSAAAPVYDGRLATVSPSASASELRGVSSWSFRTIPNDSATGAALARFATRLGERAVVIYENDSYGRGLANAFRAHYKGHLVSIDPVSPQPGDLGPLVTYFVRVARPQVVFMAGVDRTGLTLLREAKRQGLKAEFLGGDGWIGMTEDTVAAEGAYVGVPFDPSDPRPAAQEFARSFRALYGHNPDAYAALAYDAANVVIAAVLASKGDRRGIRNYLAALRETGGPEAVTGRLSFDRAGDREEGTMVMTRVRRGTLTAIGAY